MNKKIKLAIVDDHSLFRQGLALLVGGFERVNVIMEASNGEELIEKLKSQAPDVILMDLKMPKMDGFEATAHVRQQYPDIKIIALTMYTGKKFIIEMIRMGAHGYLFKDAELNEVKSAVYAVMEKGFYFNDYLTEAMFKGWANMKNIKPSLNGDISLTTRELQVLKLICKELSSPEIAEKLSLSLRTVEGHRINLTEKIGVKNIAGLVIYAMENDLVEINLRKQ